MKTYEMNLYLNSARVSEWGEGIKNNLTMKFCEQQKILL